MKILVTGASAGIGRATAQLLCKEHDVIWMARRQESLDALVAEFGGTVAVLDVSSKAAVRAAHEAWFDVDVVVNNAGLARGVDSMQTANPDDWATMIDTNLTGLLEVTRRALPHVIRRAGHIVNLGSVAGRWTYPGGGVYCATKHAVRAISEGLRMDLMGTAVRVTNIEPGLVETEFSKVRFDGDDARADAVYNDTVPLRAEDVAETIAWCLSRPKHVNVQELVLYPTKQASVRDVERT